MSKRRDVNGPEIPKLAFGDELDDRLGLKLFGDKAERWLRILNDPADRGGYEARTSDEELVAAVQFVATQHATKPAEFTVEKMFSWLKWHRKTAAAERRGWDPDTEDGFIPRIRHEIRRARDYMSRWNILCDPLHYLPHALRDTTYAECRRLEAWCWDEGLLPRRWRPTFATKVPETPNAEAVRPAAAGTHEPLVGQSSRSGWNGTPYLDYAKEES
jgi:hypothetical protein